MTCPATDAFTPGVPRRGHAAAARSTSSASAGARRRATSTTTAGPTSCRPTAWWTTGSTSRIRRRASDYWYVNHKLMQSGPGDPHLRGHVGRPPRPLHLRTRGAPRLPQPRRRRNPALRGRGATQLGWTTGDNSRGVLLARPRQRRRPRRRGHHSPGPSRSTATRCAAGRPGARHWIGLALEGDGTACNREAAGTRVSVAYVEDGAARGAGAGGDRHQRLLGAGRPAAVLRPGRLTRAGRGERVLVRSLLRPPRAARCRRAITRSANDGRLRQPRRARAVVVHGRALVRGARGRALSIDLLGRRIALWRGQDGRVRASTARCAHLGADLGQGQVVGDDLRCRLPSLDLRRDGPLRDVPSFRAGARLARAVSMPSRSATGPVFLFNGPAAGFSTTPRSELAGTTPICVRHPPAPRAGALPSPPGRRQRPRRGALPHRARPRLPDRSGRGGTGAASCAHPLGAAAAARRCRPRAFRLLAGDTFTAIFSTWGGSMATIEGHTGSPRCSCSSPIVAIGSRGSESQTVLFWPRDAALRLAKGRGRPGAHGLGALRRPLRARGPAFPAGARSHRCAAGRFHASSERAAENDRRPRRTRMRRQPPQAAAARRAFSASSWLSDSTASRAASSP